MTEHPITPPLSLMQQWEEEWECFTHVENIPTGSNRLAYIAAQAAQWGADQELEACCGLLIQQGFDVVDDLRAARRPKPPSLKEQALAVLDDASDRLDAAHENTIRRALEQLDD
jgi:hypothetical protein